MKKALCNIITLACLCLAGCAPAAVAAGYPFPVAAQGEELYVAQENGLLQFSPGQEAGRVLCEGPAFAVGVMGDDLYYGVYRLAAPLAPRAMLPVMDIAESQLWLQSLSGQGEARLLYRTTDVITQAYAYQDKLLCSFGDGETESGLFTVSLADGGRRDIRAAHSPFLCLYGDAAYYVGPAGGVCGLDLKTGTETQLYTLAEGSAISLYPCEAGIYFVGYNGQYPDPDVSFRLFLLPWEGGGAECLGLDFYARRILYAAGDWVYFESPAAIGASPVDLARLNTATGARETLLEDISAAVYATDAFALYRPDNTKAPWDRATLWRYDYESGYNAALYESEG